MRTTILGREAFVFFPALVVCAVIQFDVAHAEEDSAHIRGKLLYGRLCSNCHGPEGHPSKEIQSLLIPPPTDLIQFVHSLERSGDDSIPQSIIRAIEDGGRRNRLHFSGQLSDQQLRALADYLRSLAATAPTAPRADAKPEAEEVRDDSADPGLPETIDVLPE